MKNSKILKALLSVTAASLTTIAMAVLFALLKLKILLVAATVIFILLNIARYIIFSKIILSKPDDE